LQEIPNTSTKILARSNLKGLPKRFEDRGFGNFKTSNDFLKSTVEFCKKFYAGLTEKNSLILCGNVGNGKTHLAVAILKNLPDIPSKINGTRKQNAQFLIADEFFMNLTDAAQSGKSKLALIKSWLYDNDIVCLDDLGTYNMTSAKIENLYEFINCAYLEMRRIIVTTNFTMKDFDQYDKRIASRFQEMAHIIAFQQSDFRKS
jgi:DNA replication protein DnaC